MVGAHGQAGVVGGRRRIVSVQPETPEQAQVDVQDVAALPAIEEVLADGFDGLQAASIEPGCALRETPLR